MAKNSIVWCSLLTEFVLRVCVRTADVRTQTLSRSCAKFAFSRSQTHMPDYDKLNQKRRRNAMTSLIKAILLQVATVGILFLIYFTVGASYGRLPADITCIVIACVGMAPSGLIALWGMMGSAGIRSAYTAQAVLMTLVVCVIWLGIDIWHGANPEAMPIQLLLGGLGSVIGLVVVCGRIHKIAKAILV